MKSGRSFTDFEFLIKLDKANSVEVGNTYLIRKQGLEFDESDDEGPSVESV